MNIRTLVGMAILIMLMACSIGEKTSPNDLGLGLDNPVTEINEIPGQYIVVFKDKGLASQSVQDFSLSVQSFSSDVGVQMLMPLRIISGFVATNVSKEQLRTLINDPRVAYIEQDQIITINATQGNATWGLDRIDQRNLPLDNSYTYDTSASSVTAYVIDTGILSTHNEFGNRVVEGYTAINDGRGSEDCNGHGTHVAGTIGGANYGVAKGVKLSPVRVLDCNGSGSNSGVIAGVDWVTSNHQKPAVANMSLGGGTSSALDSAVNNSIAAGVIYVVAAGNSNRNACNYSPARVSNALTVGATTSSDSRASFSNFGTCVDIFAPGSSITSAWYTSNSAINTIDGTSMASPHVAGGAALYLQDNPNASAASVFNALIANASSGKISGEGTGSPDLLLYTGTEDDSGGGGGNPNPGPCTSCESFSGNLSGTGDSDYQPNGTYYFSNSGTHNGYLRGSVGDFDLYLLKWQNGWRRVAQAETEGSSEDISYRGSAGYYVWQVRSYRGNGSYTFYLDRP